MEGAPTEDPLNSIGEAQLAAFARAARLAASGLRGKAALVIDAQGRHVLGKSGLDGDALSPDIVRSLSRALGARVCSSVDTHVAALPGIGGAMGVAVFDADRSPCASIWVLHAEPQEVEPWMCAFLNDLAPMVADALQTSTGDLRAEKAEARLREAVDALSDGLVYLDEDDRVVLCNQRYRELYARSAHAIVPGVQFEDVLSAGLANGQYPEAKGREAEWLAEQRESRGFCDAPFERELPDGRWIKVEDKQTASGGTIGLRVDITRLKQQQRALEVARASLQEQNEILAREIEERNAKLVAEERARLAEAQLSEAISAMTNGFAYFDADDRLVHCSDRSRAIFHEISEFITPGRPYGELLREGARLGVFPELAGIDIATFCEERRRQRLQAPLYTERTLPTGVVIQDIEQAVPSGGWIALQFDITDLKLQQQELEAARTELAKQNEVLEAEVEKRTAQIAEQAREIERALEEEREITEAQRRFVAMVSHEFRTPLSIIDAAAGRIRRRAKKGGEDWAGSYVEMINGSVKRLITLIESVLGAARRATGKIDLKLSEIDICRTLEEICDSQRTVSTDREISVARDEPVLIRADRSLVYQIFTNLVGNAVKYSDTGQPVRVTITTAGALVKIAVQDQGVGIPANEMPKMFGRFFRASTSSGVSGTGIGLNLARDFARLHGGDIDINSEVGVGSTFTVSLPIAGPDIDETGRNGATANEAPHAAE